MISKTNLKNVLRVLGFTAHGDLFQKSIGDVELKVDFQNGQIVYPEYRRLKVNERQICNFLRNENFVVLECVHRVLEKGYKPEHLELEPKWKVGHGSSGGRADILVKNHANDPLILIECKTPGAEFEKAWENTKHDGAQLFSYAQQIAEVQYLCLYTSNLIENDIRIDHRIISHCDNAEILEQNAKLLSFASVTDVKDRFAVWRDTYELEYTESGIFEENIQAYQIGKSNYTLSEDTKALDAVDKEGKYHQFRTILRKHNIARRENAFEVLVNLFLCKIVDEEENKTDLKFYWKGIASDNYFDFVDRLQDLYQKGMRKYLNEEISYISNEQIDSAFWTIKNKSNATKKQIQAYFRELKFFTNSAFSFLDTHNENLFTKNAKVLLEIVQMWQGVQLKTDCPNQFLGDMFEYFLDNSIKQSEGQFFTPLPICKFIVASLPLSQMIEHGSEPIKAIDFACGAGHFLTEYAHQIAPLVEAQGANPSDYYTQIIGIEKEDRLAKVAKVASYMYGQEQIKILDADALASHSEVPLANFDVLVANPPFAVEGFLQTLSEEDKKQYQLVEATGQNSNTNSIQCFFIERIHHLLAPGGVAGVIVPSSILSNSDAVNVRTRELILQFFDIVSIAELGGGTFGKTATNTAVLFLRRKTQKPEVAEHYTNRVNDFFEGDMEDNAYQDSYLIQAYCNHIEVPYEQYIKLFAQTNLEQPAELLQYDVFKTYQQDFDASAKIKNRKKSKTFRMLTTAEQDAEIESSFIAYLHTKEKDKLLYFILAHEQENSVLIVNAPNTVKERKQFLGYEWSDAKGSEGIKYNDGETVNDIITPLFDPKDLDNRQKINTAIKRNFVLETIDEVPPNCRYAKLTDMLDFSRKNFNKAINLNPREQIQDTMQSAINAGYEIRKLGEITKIIRGVTYSKNDESVTPTSKIILTADNITIDGTFALKKQIFLRDSVKLDDEKRLMANDLFVCFSSGSRKHVGKMAYIKNNTQFYAGGFMAILRTRNSGFLNHYLFELLNIPAYKTIIKNTCTGSNINNLSGTLKEIKIPVPPLEVQQHIVYECGAVDEETENCQEVVATKKQRIQDLITSAERTSTLNQVVYRLPDIINPIEKHGSVINVGLEHIESQTGALVGDPQSDFSKIKSHKNVFRKGDILYGKLRPNLNKVYLASIDGICSTDILVLRPFEPTISMFYKHFLLSEEFNSDVLGTVAGQQLPRTSWEKIERIPVPEPDIASQLVAEIKQLEIEITQTQAVIDNAVDRKNAILAHYLF